MSFNTCPCPPKNNKAVINLLLLVLLVSFSVKESSSFGFLARNTFQYYCHSYGVSSKPQQRRAFLTIPKEPGGRDGFVASASNQAKTAIRKKPTKFRQIIGGLSIPAAAVAGFLFTCSRRILAHCVGAAIA